LIDVTGVRLALNGHQTMNELAAKGIAKRDALLRRARAQGVLFSYCADIWGENGIAMLGLTAVYINDAWQLVEVFLRAVPFTEVAHNGTMIKKELVSTLYGAGLATRSEVEPAPSDYPVHDDAAKVRVRLCL
jgi:hypothetical protein